ncbi:di-/tripeptide transporter [Klebsiella pneumoniae]|uniref:Di-/tripeptide transporter n=1 Tax=Klebsiella pneumoniae TaxID=573 RepID=A0A377V954_KLEPN|nr:di-/tripeptide transporter [Klebsiella pneumoniae]
MTKFVIGILCAAAGFGLMMLAAQNVLSNGGAGVSPLWLVGSILMLTLGELWPQPDWAGDHDSAGAGENARPDDGAVVLRQRAG